MVFDRSKAPDRHQESFRLILMKIGAGQVRKPARLSGFICSLVRKVGLGHLRKASRWNNLQDLKSETRPGNPTIGPLDELLREEQAAVIGTLMAGPLSFASRGSCRPTISATITVSYSETATPLILIINRSLQITIARFR